MSDDYQSIPVAAARAAVQESGQLEGVEGPHYAVGDLGAFGAMQWSPAFRASDEHPHPAFARVVITRKEQKPREVVISWDEYEAEIETEQERAWAEGRRLKPMSIFGAEVERHAYRVVFADVLAAAFPPVERPSTAPDAEPWEPPARDWIAEAKAADAQTLNALYDEARAAGALAKVDGLQAAIMDRTLDLEHPPVKLPPPPVTPEQIAATRRAGENLPPRPQGQGSRRRRGKPRP